MENIRVSELKSEDSAKSNEKVFQEFCCQNKPFYERLERTFQVG